MGKRQKPCLKFICGIVMYLSFALLLSLGNSEAAFRKVGSDPNYAALLKECKKIKLSDGTTIQTVPKLVPTPLAEACAVRKSKYGPPPIQRVCRFPDCYSNPCQNGWCEETLEDYQCHCFPGFHGKQCSERSRVTTEKSTISTSDSMSRSASESPSDLTTAVESTSPTDATTVTQSDPILPATPPISTLDSPTNTGSSPTTDTSALSASDSMSRSTSASTCEPTSITDLYETSHDTSPTSTTISRTTAEKTMNPTTYTASLPKIFVSDTGVIFVADLRDELNFTQIPSTGYPTYIRYDSLERKIFWNDADIKRIYRSHVNGSSRDFVTVGTNEQTSGIAFAEKSRTLYVAYYSANKIVSVSIERGSPLPGTEIDFVNQGISRPRALAVDESEGYLYIAMEYSIARAVLNATNVIEVIYHNSDFTSLFGLSIDLNKYPRRIVFCDTAEKRIFYKDLSTPLNTASAVELTGYLQDPGSETITDVNYWNGVLYMVKQNNPKGIGIMTNYDQTNRSYRVQEISQFMDPRRIFISFL